jgi:hypothetical protein
MRPKDGDHRGRAFGFAVVVLRDSFTRRRRLKLEFIPASDATEASFVASCWLARRLFDARLPRIAASLTGPRDPGNAGRAIAGHCQRSG